MEMRIKEIRPFAYKNYLLIRTKTDDGTVGWGECSPMNLPVITMIVREIITPHVVGRNPFDIGVLMSELSRKCYKVNGQLLWMAISGVEISLWDIMGKALDMPVYQLLGGALRKKIPMYASSMRRDLTPGELAEQMYVAVNTYGFKGVKIKIGTRGGALFKDKFSDIVERVELVRKRLGDEIDLMVDANSAFSAHEALQLGRRLEQYNLFHYEEPCAYRDLDAHGLVASQLSVPIALGEQEWDIWQFKRMLDVRAAGIIQPDIIKAGGFTAMNKICTLAQTSGVVVTPHQTKPYGTIINLHLAAVRESIRYYQEYNIDEIDMGEGFFDNAPPIRDGFIQLPQEPGIGVRFSSSVMEALNTPPSPGTGWDSPRSAS